MTARRNTVAVAYSAGRDSTALLHATARAGREQGFDVVALHVHHGLMPQADAWLEFAQAQCKRWHKAGLPVQLLSARLAGQPGPGDSVEAWARRERRLALARMAREAGIGAILLAQHRRDQAETVLLQALRGAGPAGLAAMPRAVERDGLWWLRPWLDQPSAVIDAYVRQHRLRHVEDASNADPRFSRSRLRVQVWPALLESFADAETALVAVARRAHEANEVLREVAVADLIALSDGPRLNVTQWAALSAARRANALRVWLQRVLERGAPETLVARLLDDLPRVRSGRWPIDGRLQLALHRGWVSRIEVDAGRDPASADERAAVDLSRVGVHALPCWGGVFEVSRVARGGVAASALRACTLRARRGGEQFQAGPRGVARSLKKQYQAAGVPAWQRDGPLVYAGEQLLFVPGLGFDARMLAAHAAGRGFALRWCPIEPGA